MQSEVEDRYGHPPEPVRNAFAIMALRMAGRHLGFDKVDATQGRISAHARAPNVRAARTMVFVRCFKGDKVGDYGWLQGAYKRTCDVVGFDMSALGGPTILATTSVDKEPPTTISSAEIWYAFHDVVPSRPVDAIASYVKGELGSAQP